MKYKLLIKAEAIQDMIEAFDWYENKQVDWGQHF